MGYGAQLSAIIAIGLISGAAIIAAVALSGAALTASNNADAKAQNASNIAQSIFDMMYPPPPPVKRSVAAVVARSRHSNAVRTVSETYFEMLVRQLTQLDNDLKRNTVQTFAWSDFRQTLPVLGRCDPAILVGAILYPVSTAEAFTTFGSLDQNVLGNSPPFTCSPTMSSHTNSRLKISTVGASTPTGANLWKVSTAIAANAEETMTYEAIALFSSTVNASESAAAYGNALVVGGADKDIRVTRAGIIMLTVDTSTPACGAACVVTVCFFASKTAVWAFHDYNINFIPFSANSRYLAKAVKVADYDTSIPHVYRAEYDTKNRQARWFIDSVLVHSERVNGTAIVPAAGNLWKDIGFAPVPLITPRFATVFLTADTGVADMGVWPNGAALEGGAFAGLNFPTTFGAAASLVSSPVQPVERASTVEMDIIHMYTHEYRAL